MVVDHTELIFTHGFPTVLRNTTRFLYLTACAIQSPVLAFHGQAVEHFPWTAALPCGCSNSGARGQAVIQGREPMKAERLFLASSQALLQFITTLQDILRHNRGDHAWVERREPWSSLQGAQSWPAVCPPCQPTWWGTRIQNLQCWRGQATSANVWKYHIHYNFPCKIKDLSNDTS